MAIDLINEEKKRLSSERQKAVRNAWKEEKARVISGQGTREWSLSQQKEIISRGAVSGYEGHHMKSASLYPEYAGDSENIQFLSEKEHLDAHSGNYHNATNGYYDPVTQTLNEFEDNELEPVPVNELGERYFDERNASISQVKEIYISEEASCETSTNTEGLSDAKSTYVGSFSASDEGESEGAFESSSECHGIGR